MLCPIIGQVRPDLAQNFYKTVQTNVNMNGHILFTYELDGVPTGLIYGHRDQNDGPMWVDLLFVDKEFRKNGIGSKLLKAYEQYASSLHAEDICLYAVDDEKSVNFYVKNKYKMAIKQCNLMAKNLDFAKNVNGNVNGKD